MGAPTAGVILGILKTQHAVSAVTMYREMDMRFRLERAEAEMAGLA